MPMRTRWLSGIFAVAAVLCVAACSQQSATTAVTSASASSGEAVAGPLRIIGWGPKLTRAGVAFNVQPDGSAALWMRLNRSMEGYDAGIDVNGTLLQGSISGDLVTAAVPTALYAKPGSYDVHVVARKGARFSQSNVVAFTVE